MEGVVGRPRRRSLPAVPGAAASVTMEGVVDVGANTGRPTGCEQRRRRTAWNRRIRGRGGAGRYEWEMTA